MKCDLSQYADKKICVAVSGGRDSVALLHFLYKCGGQYGITLCAVNCDHGIRWQTSARDSEFVADLCKQLNVPLKCFKEDCVALAEKTGESVETASRKWRHECYLKAAKKFNADAVATAHHSNDNAETLLFNLARGSSLSGLMGIYDCTIDKLNLIRPFIGCSRRDIDGYIAQNGLAFVEDETNSTCDYTRNKIRHNVLPRLEEAVPEAASAIYRFSRLAAEDEKYFESEISRLELLKITPYGAEIKTCDIRPLFKRAALKALKALNAKVKDYTSEHAERLFNLQFAENAKKFEFLSFTAFKEEGKIAICTAEMLQKNAQEILKIIENDAQYAPVKGEKVLKLDKDCIPEGACVRFMREGDRFRKFGGGEKNLGDFFTDKKIPVRLRANIPLIAKDNEILAVCGVEISDRVKITDKTRNIICVVCTDFCKP